MHEPVQIKRKGENMAAFTKMFTKRENKNWVNDVKIEADEKNIFCNNELKSILIGFGLSEIGFGLSEKFEMFESLKLELKEKNIENEHLKTLLKKQSQFSKITRKSQ